jgi:hypothetical protein
MATRAQAVFIFLPGIFLLARSCPLFFTNVSYALLPRSRQTQPNCVLLGRGASLYSSRISAILSA